MNLKQSIEQKLESQDQRRKNPENRIVKQFMKDNPKLVARLLKMPKEKLVKDSFRLISASKNRVREKLRRWRKAENPGQKIDIPVFKDLNDQIDYFMKQNPKMVEAQWKKSKPQLVYSKLIARAYRCQPRARSNSKILRQF
jgi:hypothetical protein